MNYAAMLDNAKVLPPSTLQLYRPDKTICCGKIYCFFLDLLRIILRFMNIYIDIHTCIITLTQIGY